MIGPNIETDTQLVRLIDPDVARDAQKGMEWLNSENGKETLVLMGVSEEDISETNLAAEEKRVKGFIEGEDQLNWAIEYDGQVVGAIWVDIKDTENLKSPSVHIMIGDASARGKGVGKSAALAVVEYLKAQGHKEIYSRYMTANETSRHMLGQYGFKEDGEVYVDDGVEFQNVVLAL